MALGAVMTLGSWEFYVREYNGQTFLSVPDCGGMADSVPRVPEQLAWAEEVFAVLPGLEHVWPTAWRVPPDLAPALERLLRDRGVRW
ncbi:MAG TPA: hypothetical protein VIK91_11275 [Nannocystis sp.]